MPGLSTMKSLPCCMTRTPSGARSSGMLALTTIWMALSSRISLSVRATFACGKRFAKSASEIGFLGVDGHQLAAAANGRRRLAADMAVIEADDRELDLPGVFAAAGAV